MLSSLIGNIRRNHALEHATVSLLLAKLGPNLRLVGRATGDGFFIYGNVPVDALGECAREGLARLKRGEEFWAVTPLCGTNLATAGALAALSTMAVLGSSNRRSDKIPSAIFAGVVSVTLAQPLGKMLQRYVTTSPDLSDTEIVSIERRGKGGYFKVRTRRGAGLARPVLVA